MKRPAFQDYQLQLAAHIRDPDHQPRPDGTRKHRVRVYSELVFNNINTFLEAAFPVLRRVVRKKRWHRLVRAFLRDYRSPYPLFRHIPLAMLDFLAGLDLDAAGLPPFALELAHYEWLELQASVHPATIKPSRGMRLSGDRGVRVNATLELHAYRFAVQRVSRTWVPDTPEPAPVFLAVWRNQRHEVRFMQLNAGAAQLLHALREGATLDQAATAAGLDPAAPALSDLLQEWHAQAVLLGVRALRTRPAGRGTTS